MLYVSVRSKIRQISSRRHSSSYNRMPDVLASSLLCFFLLFYCSKSVAYKWCHSTNGTLVGVQVAVIASLQSRRGLVYSLGTQWISRRCVVRSGPMFTRDTRQKSGRDKCNGGLCYRVVSTIAVLSDNATATSLRSLLCSHKMTAPRLGASPVSRRVGRHGLNENDTRAIHYRELKR